MAGTDTFLKIIKPAFSAHLLIGLTLAATVVVSSSESPQPVVATDAGRKRFEEFKARAESGDATAQYNVGHRVHGEFAIGVP